MVRPSLINMNPVEPEYYPFMISLNECAGSCTVLSPKIWVPKETKDINVKGFNMITNKDQVKPMTEHISCNCKWKFNSTTCNSNQKWSYKRCQCECKNYGKCKEYYSWNPSKCVYENKKYLKSIGDNSVVESDEIIIVLNNVSRKKANTIAANVTSTASINYHSKKVRDCYILHIVLLVIILLCVIIIICYYYAKQKGTV